MVLYIYRKSNKYPGVGRRPTYVHCSFLQYLCRFLLSNVKFSSVERPSVNGSSFISNQNYELGMLPSCTRFGDLISTVATHRYFKLCSDNRWINLNSTTLNSFISDCIKVSESSVLVKLLIVLIGSGGVDS